MIKSFILIFIGGGIGSLLRWLMSIGFMRMNESGFPFTTLFINVIGSFLIGVFSIVMADKLIDQSAIRSLLIIGLCGGFTTFSAFSIENVNLILNGHFTKAVLYILASVILCLAATFSGVILAKNFTN